MNIRRSQRVNRLSAREARLLRRLEDAAVSEDPLLELRLGLPANRLKGSAVAVRRRLKSMWRVSGHRWVWAIVGLNAIVIAATLLGTRSVTAAVWLSLPLAFAIGVAVPRPARVPTARADAGIQRVREHPGVE